MPNKGYKQTEEHKRKLSCANKGCQFFLGKKHSEESKQKIGAANRVANTGQVHSKEWRENMSASVGGEKHWNWQGGKSWKRVLHFWVEKQFGYPRECVYCGVRDLKRKNGSRCIQFANVSNTYKKELSDWMTLCQKCHSRYDADYRTNLTN